jgi:hypothetical protein
MRIRQAAEFLRANRGRAAAVSGLLLAPCFWQRRIEAGDLASHTYNAWLAQLIERGQAPGLYIVRQWNNILVDVVLLHLGNVVGVVLAEKIVVAACVLLFFWGAFAFIAAATGRPPWVLVPGVAMITYGWTFHMGFMNYYVSLGLAFLAAALLWRGRGGDLVVGLGLAGLVLLAHPMGLGWLVGVLAYVKLAEKAKGWRRWVLFGSALLIVSAVSYYITHHLRAEFWDTAFFYEMNGADQLALFGGRYENLAWVVLVFGSVCWVYGAIHGWKRTESRWAFRIPLELWTVLLFTAAMIPEVIYLPWYPAPVGLVVSRLTSISAVLGLCVLGCVQPKKWHLAGLGACAAVFFGWLYQDTGVLNRMEGQVEELVAALPYGRRVTETLGAPLDSRIYFINHIVDRACIGRCFTYANYEPSSGQFRIRVKAGSPLATASSDASEDMEQGEYVVRPEDLPMVQIYQCDENDLTRLCMRELAAGEKNGRIGHHPPPQ